MVRKSHKVKHGKGLVVKGKMGKHPHMIRKTRGSHKASSM